MKKPLSIFIQGIILGAFLVPFLFWAGEAENQESLLQFRVDPPFFSPNGDGFQDQTFFYPVLKTPALIKKWVLDIEKLKGKEFVRLSGTNLPALIKWEGLDKKGEILPNGEYLAQLEVVGEKLKDQALTKVVIDTISPVVQVFVSTPVLGMELLAGQKFMFQPLIKDSSPLDRWQLQILDLTGGTVFVSWSNGPVTSLVWDGVNQTTAVLAPKGTYRCVLQAWDAAGNISSPAFVDVSIKVTSRERLEQAIEKIKIYETELGLLVQFPSEGLFTMSRNKLLIKDEAKELLREMALLINAYPDVPVRIDGYSEKMKNGSINRHQSSLYAWSVYSYLVRKENVLAPRLTVRGRAKSPLFNRRALQVPVLSNGVEILLEGEGGW